MDWDTAVAVSHSPGRDCVMLPLAMASSSAVISRSLVMSRSSFAISESDSLVARGLTFRTYSESDAAPHFAASKRMVTIKIACIPAPKGQYYAVSSYLKEVLHDPPPHRCSPPPRLRPRRPRTRHLLRPLQRPHLHARGRPPRQPPLRP